MGHKARAGARSVMAALLALSFAGAESVRAQIADDYQSAGEVGANITWGDANDVYTSTGEPFASGSMWTCTVTSAPNNTFQIDRTFWRKVIGTGGPITVSTWTTPTVDTALAVYQANTQPTVDTVLGCVDDLDATTTAAEFTFDSVKGATYYTQWGNCANSTPMPSCPGTPGTIHHTVLTNDVQAFAESGSPGLRTNVGAIRTEPGERTDCKGVPYGATVWFSYAAPAPGSVSFEISHLGGHLIAVYRGTTFFDCNADAAGNNSLSRVIVPNAGKGETFLVQIGGRITAGVAHEDSFTYNVNFTESRDLDGDGFPKPPGPDCDDANPGINPGARDVPGNRVDEDCKDGDAPYPRLLSTVEVGAKRGRLTLLRAKRVPAGATIRLRCNRRCVRRAVVRVSKAGTVSLLRTLRKRRLAKGTALTVTITLPGHVGTVSTIRVNKNRRLSKSDACLPPGVPRPVRC